jgi:hypothetical protein
VLILCLCCRVCRERPCNWLIPHLGKNYWHLDRLCGLVVKFLPTDPEARVRFQALPDFLRSSGSGTGSTQLREYNWGPTWKKISSSGLENREYDRGDLLRWPRDILYKQIGTNFADRRRSLGRYSSLAD